MISDEKLAKVSFVVAVLGIAAVYVSIVLIGPEHTDIVDISGDDSGKQVSVSGTINSFSSSNGNIFIMLGDGTGNITVVMFERTARGQKDVYELQDGDNISVNGQISIYKGELEIIANRIMKVE